MAFTGFGLGLQTDVNLISIKPNPIHAHSCCEYLSSLARFHLEPDWPPCKVLLLKVNVTAAFTQIVTLHQKHRVLLIPKKSWPSVSSSPFKHIAFGLPHGFCAHAAACWGQPGHGSSRPHLWRRGTRWPAAYMGDMSGPQPQFCLEKPLCPPQSPLQSAMAPGGGAPSLMAQGSMQLIGILHLLGSDRVMPVLPH